MKKSQWLFALLYISIGCLTHVNAQAKSITKHHHKKASHQTKWRPITEQDITECAQLISRVSANQAVSNSKVAAHLKPAETQLFGSDKPASISMPTVAMPVQKPLKPVTPTILSSSGMVNKPAIPLATLAPAPVFKATTATLIAPVGTGKVAALPSPDTEKLQSLPLTTAPTAKKLDTISPKYLNSPPASTFTIKPTAANKVHHNLPVQPNPPAIELFSPYKAADLNKLEGKSASLTAVKHSRAHSKTKK